MSDYSPLDDHAPSPPLQQQHKQQQQSKEERSTSSYPSHPYSSGYDSSYTSYQNQSASQVIEVSPPSAGGYSGYGEPSAGPSTFSSQEGGQRVSRYETSLSLRYDVEAGLAYALGMVSGAFLLVFERKNDYVRFHAWQSSLFSTGAVLLLIVMAMVSKFLYWVVLALTIGTLSYMARRAYIDGAIFERFALPYVGQIAMQFVDEE